jgi:hypothetical protein
MCIPQRDVAIKSDGFFAVLEPPVNGSTDTDIVQCPEKVFDLLTDAIRQHTLTKPVCAVEKAQVDEMEQFPTGHG